MASQVLSGAANASYTNNTGQNVRLIINYMSNTTSMTWAGVNVTASATTIGKDIQNITGEFRGGVTGQLLGTTVSPIFNGPVAYTYEFKLSDKKLNLTELLSKTDSSNTASAVPPPKNPNGTYAVPGDTRNDAPPLATPTEVNNTTLGPTQGVESNDNLNYRPFFGSSLSGNFGQPREGGASSGNIFYVPLTVSRGGNFPVELMLSNGQAFSAVCGAFNAIVIKEDGT